MHFKFERRFLIAAVIIAIFVHPELNNNKVTNIYTNLK